MADFWDSFSFDSSPAVKPEQTVIKNGVRISVLTPYLLRAEKQSNSVFCDTATQSVVCRDFDSPAFSYTANNERIVVTTEKCEFCYSFLKNAPEYVKLENGKKVTDFNKGNLKGTCRTLDGSNGAVRLGNGIISVNGVALLDDSASLCVFQNGEIKPRKCRETDIYYFAYGHNYKLALYDYFRLTGMPPLVPRFTLGNWWSRYKAYTQSEYTELMQRFIDEEIPVTVATVDMDWHWTDVIDRFGKDAWDKSPRKNALNLFYTFSSPGWTGYSWNTELFPDPKGFLKWLKDRNFKVTMNLHPASGCKFYEDAYPEFAVFMGANKDKKEQIRFDITDRKFTEGYFKYLHHPHEEDGVDFWWIDWQQGTKTNVPGLDPLWALNHYHYYDLTRKNKRPLILSRFAGAGSHRYPLGFSGDTSQTWETLDFQPYFTANAANIGYTWWSHDIGGHHFGVRDDELYLRWVQFGVFSPVNRLHSTSNEFMGKEPWKYKAGVRILATEALRFRHRLIPYTYSMNRLCSVYGRPLCEPMYYEHPENVSAYEVPNEYYFGTELIACPITAPADKKTNLAGVKVYLPEGRYTDIFSDRIYTGGRTVELFRDEGSIPVLAKEGAIIPLDKNDRTNDCSNPSELELWIYRGNSSFTMYEDDGETLAYKTGKYAETLFKVSEKGRDVTFEIFPVCGDVSVLPEKRDITLTFRDITNAEHICVICDGRARNTQIIKKHDRAELLIKNIPYDKKITVTLKNVTVRTNRSKKEHLIELFSKLQGLNFPKQSLYTDFVLKNAKAMIPGELKGPVKELEALF